MATIPVGADITTSDGDFGNRLLVGPAMRYFTVVTEEGLIQVDNPWAPSTINLNDGDDTFTGTGLFDEILGNGGNDTLFALGGNDISPVGRRQRHA